MDIYDAITGLVVAGVIYGIWWLWVHRNDPPSEFPGGDGA